MLKNLVNSSENMISNQNCNFNNPNNPNKKKIESLKKDHQKMHKSMLVEILKKLIKNFLPIEYRIIANRYFKIKEIDNIDTLDDMINKIDTNKEM